MREGETSLKQTQLFSKYRENVSSHIISHGLENIFKTFVLMLDHQKRFRNILMTL